MPKMDGLELCKIIHEEFPHIKTVVISGYNDFEYAQKYELRCQALFIEAGNQKRCP